MFRKVIAFIILLLGVLVIVLGLCFQTEEGNSAANNLYLYGMAGSSGRNDTAASVSSAILPLTSAQQQMRGTLIKGVRLLTVALGAGILSLGLSKLPAAFEKREKPKAEFPLPAAAPTPTGAAPVMPTFDDSLPDL
jgi:hypothetical protein